MLQTKEVDSFRFIDRSTKKMVRSWIKRETPREIPWTPLERPLSESTVALISSAGLALKSDRPFDQEGERENPWWGDPSYRILPRTTTTGDVNLYHLHMNPRLVEEDINTLFPAERLLEFEYRGEIARSAEHHYSYMGYILDPQQLLQETAPAIIQQLQEDEVDIVLLVPG